MNENEKAPVTPGSLNFALYPARIGHGLLSAEDALTAVLEALDSTEPGSLALRLRELLHKTRSAAASGFGQSDAADTEALAGEIRDTLLELASRVYDVRVTATEMRMRDRG